MSGGVRGALMTMRTLTRVYPADGPAYWIRSDGAIGHDDPNDDVVHWSRVENGRLVAIGSTETSNEMLDLLQAVIDAGLDEAGIIDVPPKG